MIRDVFAGVIAAGLLFLAARLATTLQYYRRAQQRAREREETLGRTVIAEIPSEDSLMLFTEDAGRFYYGNRAIDKEQIVSAQLLINGNAIGRVGQGRNWADWQEGQEGQQGQEGRARSGSPVAAANGRRRDRCRLRRHSRACVTGVGARGVRRGQTDDWRSGLPLNLGCASAVIDDPSEHEEPVRKAVHVP